MYGILLSRALCHRGSVTRKNSVDGCERRISRNEVLAIRDEKHSRFQSEFLRVAWPSLVGIRI